MNPLRYVIIILIMVIPAFNIFPQNINELENKLMIVQNRVDAHKIKLDSLQSVYRQKVAEIDREKDKTEKDNDKIASLMSKTISLTNIIDSEQDKINLLESGLKRYKHLLNKQYTVVIDSLRILESSKSFWGNRDLLNLEILSYIEKKLYYGVETNELSYNPILLLGLDPNSIKNNPDKNIYIKYLQNAADEVESKITFISGLIKEIDQANKLQKKVNKFIEDSEFRSNPIGNPSSDKISGYTFNGEGGILDENTLSRNYKSYSNIFNQLTIQQFLLNRNTQWNSDFMINEKEFSVNSFVDLLKEINLRLENYNLLLLEKLSDLNNAGN